MPLEAARDLSIPDLLHVLREKLSLECARLREAGLGPVFSTASLGPEIENAKASACDVLRVFHSFQNLSRPVNRMPSEIFSRIVRDVPSEGDTDTRPILRLTHVCRYWREFIISTPRNWTLISDESSRLTALSLQRAKMAPLELWLRGKAGMRSRFPKLINPYIQNIETFRFSGIEELEEITQTLPNFPQSLPNLRSLTLYMREYVNRKSHSVDPFESLAPGLRRLNLTRVPLYPSFLRLRALTELNLFGHQLDLPLDTLLDFLEENRSLESATLDIGFTKPALRISRRRDAIVNQLLHLSISAATAPTDAKALISKIALQRGAHLEIVCNSYGRNPLKDFLSGIPTTHLLNLPSPTFMKYESFNRSIQLFGPNGTFSCKGSPGYSHDLFLELPLLPLTSVREVHLVHSQRQQPSVPFHSGFNPSFFPALETFATSYDIWVSSTLSSLLSNPSYPLSLKTFAFLNCTLSGDFMEELTRFASDRKNTTSARLRHVVIVDSQGNLPSVTSIEALGEHVQIVDVRVGKELPTDLT